jgi:hypothetical protein
LMGEKLRDGFVWTAATGRPLVRDGMAAELRG